ncbi:MAG: transposase [Oscillospiraceae bacterium]|nr:transposase [Oscillospiraceae bacterium]
MALPKRKPNRLVNYDYSSNGAYFVTICTHQRSKILGDIVGDGLPVLKRCGIIAEEIIRMIPEKYPCVKVDKFVVMPNHIHTILLFMNEIGTGNPSSTLGNVIGWYKYQVTKRINDGREYQKERVFQRSYHDHIIRGEMDYRKIWEYIDTNPIRWAEDCFYVE